MIKFTSEKYWWIKQLNIFQDISDADAYSLDRIVSDNELKHEERICEESVYFIKEGRIKISEDTSYDSNEKNEKRSMNSKSEEKHETKVVLEEGEMFGVFSDKEMMLRGHSEVLTYAECLTEVCIGIATFRDFSFFLKRKPHLSLPLHRRTLLDAFLRDRNKKQQGQFSSHNILDTNSSADCKDFNAFSNVAFRTESSRFALLLLNLATAPDRKGIPLVPQVSTNRLSRLVGASVETIEQLLRTFKQHQVIDKVRGRIQILNSWELKKIADARSKTLTPTKEASVIPNDDLDLAAFLNGQDQGEGGTASTINVK